MCDTCTSGTINEHRPQNLLSLQSNQSGTAWTAKQVIEKIQAILKLQEGTTFDGEADNAAKMIDMLCKKYGVTIDEATEVQVEDEIFLKFKKINVAYATLLNAIAYFYDAKAYLKTDVNGNKTIQVIGSEAQQIQVRIYFDYLVDCMEKETETAHKAEKIIAQLRVVNSLAVSKLTSAKVLLSKLWTVCKIRRNKRDEFMSTKQ